MTMGNALRLISSLAMLALADQAAAAGTGDPANGQRLISRCSGCHSIEGDNTSGPALNGVLGRKAAIVQGYNYSSALANSGITWTEDGLDTYLAGPTRLVRGTRMTISVSKEQDRADIIAYLKSLGRP
jgi:cytochrome c